MASPLKYHRRSMRIPAYDYAGPGAYFVTIVTDNRLCLFGHIENDQIRLSPRGQIAQACWRAIPDHFPKIELGAHVIMPNHVHGILIVEDRAAVKPPQVRATQWVAPTPALGRATNVVCRKQPCGPAAGSIGAIIGAYKMAVTRAIVAQFGGVPRIWQRNYYEHVIRDDDDWKRIQMYIDTNIGTCPEDDENPMR